MLENHYKIPSSFLWKLKSIQKIIGFSMIQCEYERYSYLSKLLDLPQKLKSKFWKDS